MIGRAAVFSQVLSLLFLSGTGELARGWDSTAGGAYPDDASLMYRKYRGADEVGDRDHGGGSERGSGGRGGSTGSQHGSGGGKDNQSSGGGGNTKGSGDKSNSNDGNDRFGN